MLDFSLSCSDSVGTTFGILNFSIAPPLLIYAYVPIMGISLFLGTFVLIQDKFSLRSKLLFLISIVFTSLLLNEILQWVAIPVSLVQFSWQLVPLFRILVALFTVYFVHVFITKKDFSFFKKCALSLMYISVTLFISTDLNVRFFDLNNCEGVPGVLWDIAHLFEIVSIVLVSTIVIHNSLKVDISKDEKYLNIFLGMGAISFLSIFFAASVWGDITKVYDVALVGPLGMLVFMVLLTYTIVRYNAFNIKLLGAQALVVAILVLVGSELLFVNTLTNQILVTATFILVSISGIFLIRSVKQEIAARERNEELAKELAKANIRLRELDRQKSEFVSIASHQLRSPLTSIRGYASMLLEGSYGKIPKKALDMIDRIQDSSRYMALSIEDFLNVSRIEQGRMKYELANVNVLEMAEKIIDELRSTAVKKGLALLFRSNCEGKGISYVDPGKARQIIYNIVDNSLKYTQKGSITLTVTDDLLRKKVIITVKDTGVGMSADTIGKLFDKFVRAKNANNINVSGTGLGLFVARQMTEAMQGKITAASEGEGLGSSFVIEFPMVE